MNSSRKHISASGTWVLKMYNSNCYRACFPAAKKPRIDHLLNSSSDVSQPNSGNISNSAYHSSQIIDSFRSQSSSQRSLQPIDNSNQFYISQGAGTTAGTKHNDILTGIRHKEIADTINILENSVQELKQTVDRQHNAMRDLIFKLQEKVDIVIQQHVEVDQQLNSPKSEFEDPGISVSDFVRSRATQKHKRIYDGELRYAGLRCARQTGKYHQLTFKELDSAPGNLEEELFE